MARRCNLAALSSAAALAALLLAQAANPTRADPIDSSSANADGSDPWILQGSASFYWHNRYHGLLAMASYGDYETLCPQTFTEQSLQHQYPGNTNQPFEVVGKWGPTPKYKSEGFMVRVPEMNKILMVFQGQYGWQDYPAYLSPFLGVGCDSRCMAHTGALEAWHEVKNATNDMAAIKQHQGSLVWSASGHGFGGMIAQIAAMDLKARGFAYSVHTFGAPPVFNRAAANRFSQLFPGDSSQRTVANDDSIPRAIPSGFNQTSGTYFNYTFVNTGIHVFGYSSMYGQDYEVCENDPNDERCMGGETEADHYFYYTDIGTCGRGWGATYDKSLNSKELHSDQASYYATATGNLSFYPQTASPVPTTLAATTTASAPINLTSFTIDNSTSQTQGPGALNAQGSTLTNVAATDASSSAPSAGSTTGAATVPTSFSAFATFSGMLAFAAAALW